MDIGSHEGFRCFALLLGLVPTIACGDSQPDPSCATPEDGLPVRYVGQAYGYGTIRADFDPIEGVHTVRAQMVGPESSAEIALAGPATCKEGVLRARLGGGRDDESGIRVLGGGLIVLFAHDPMSTIVGFWDVRIIREGREHGPEGKLFRGMFEAVDPDEAAPADEERQTGGQQ